MAMHVPLNMDGDRVDADVLKQVRLLVDRNAYREEAAGRELQKLDYHLLLNGMIRFETRGTWFLGRYELDGRRLRVCYPGPFRLLVSRGRLSGSRRGNA
jgi:hypothetical protein